MLLNPLDFRFRLGTASRVHYFGPVFVIDCPVFIQRTFCYTILVHYAKLFHAGVDVRRTEWFVEYVYFNTLNVCIVSKFRHGFIVLTLNEQSAVNGDGFQVHRCGSKVIDSVLVEIFDLVFVRVLQFFKNHFLVGTAHPLDTNEKVVQQTFTADPLSLFLLNLLAVVKLGINFGVFSKKLAGYLVTVLVVHIIRIYAVGGHVFSTYRVGVKRSKLLAEHHNYLALCRNWTGNVEVFGTAYLSGTVYTASHLHLGVWIAGRLEDYHGALLLVFEPTACMEGDTSRTSGVQNERIGCAVIELGNCFLLVGLERLCVICSIRGLNQL